MRILQQTVLRLNSYYLHILCTKVSTATGAVLGGEGQFLDFELVDLDDLRCVKHTAVFDSDQV